MEILRTWHHLREALGVKFRPSQIRYLPTKLQLETTNRCNLACIECYRTNLDFKAKIGDLSFVNFRKIIGQFPHLRGISLFGLGEPLMNRELGEMLEYLRSDRPKVRPYITTNGTLLDEKRVAMLLKYRVALTVSLNAATQDTYKRTTGKTRFELDEIVDNLKRLSAAGRKANLHFTICMVIMNENVEEMCEYVRLARAVGAHTAYFGEQNYDGAGNRLNDLLLRDPERVRRNIAEARQLGRKLGVQVGHSKRDPSVWGENAAFTPCMYLWKMPYISWDGFLMPCCSRPFPGVFNFGNVLKGFEDEGSPFHDLWFSAHYNALRRRVAKGCESGICDGCQHLRPNAHPALSKKVQTANP